MSNRKKEKKNIWHEKRGALLAPFMTKETEKFFHRVDVGSECVDLSCIKVYGELEERIITCTRASLSHRDFYLLYLARALFSNGLS